MKKVVVLLVVLLLLAVSSSAYSYSYSNSDSYNNYNMRSSGFTNIDRNYYGDSGSSGYTTIEYTPIQGRLYLGNINHRRYDSSSFQYSAPTQISRNYHNDYNVGRTSSYGNGNSYSFNYGYPSSYRNNYISRDYRYADPNYGYRFGYHGY